MVYFNPRSPCGERLYRLWLASTSHTISTHAPRAGSDCPGIILTFFNTAHFNPRSPCGERHCRHRPSPPTHFISTHAPRAGSDQARWCRWGRCSISTHAPRAGSDTSFPLLYKCLFDFNPRSPCGERQQEQKGHKDRKAFQPTLPVRGATTAHFKGLMVDAISTHAPRAGSDYIMPASTLSAIKFQPTLPVRGATESSVITPAIKEISTHAPRAGSDSHN